MVTFSYIENNFPNSLEMFIRNGENAFLGVAAGSIIEFLGRCLSESPEIPNGPKDFNRFIDKYLSKQDSKYKMYSQLLYEDLRHGSAHNSLSNGGTMLSLDSNGSGLHLGFAQYKNISGGVSKCLFIYSPKFVLDIKEAIKEFVKDAKNDQKLEASYLKTIVAINAAGQSLINRLYPGDKGSYPEVDGDISI